MVKRNTYNYDYSDQTLEQDLFSMVGIYGSATTECSISRLYHSSTLSKQLTNDIYQLLIDSGYSDAVKDEDNYMITVLGFKFLCIINTMNTLSSSSSFKMIPVIIPFGYFNDLYFSAGYYETSFNSTTTSHSEYIICDSSNKNNVAYNLLLRGDSNGFSIYYGSYNNPTNKYNLFCIRKCKRLTDNKDMYFFSKSLNTVLPGSTRGLFFENDSSYTEPIKISTSSSSFCSSNNQNFSYYYSANGYNTNYKYITEPQLAYNGCILLHSIIKSNTSIFTNDNYYKIGNDVYFCEGNVLFKVE